MCRLSRVMRVKMSISVATIFFASGAAHAMTCAEFNGLAGATTQEDIIATRATTEQFEEFKSVISHHAGVLASAGMFSDRNRAFQFVADNDMLGWIMLNSLDMTRSLCVDRRNEAMRDVAIEQFDYLLDAVAEGRGM